MRASVRNKLKRNANASESWAREVASRRPLSKSSLRRADDAKGEDTPDVVFSPKYVHDSEAYKNRPGVKDDVMKLLKQGDRIAGLKMT